MQTIKKILKKLTGYHQVQTQFKGTNNMFSGINDCAFQNCILNGKGNNNQIRFSPGSNFSNVTVYILGSDNVITIGKRVHIKQGTEIWITGNNCKVEIGNDSIFYQMHLACAESNTQIQIGNECLFAYNIDVRTGDSHPIFNKNSTERINKGEDVKIGNHCWIASHVSILKGATIPDDCIVGTRSVVTRKFDQPNTLIVGVPASVRKQNIEWKDIDITQ